MLIDSDSDCELSRLPAVPLEQHHRGRGWRRRSVGEYIAEAPFDKKKKRRIKKALGREVEAAQDEATDHRALQGAWDRTRTLAGDTTPGAAEHKHSNCWNAPVVTKLAFEALGQAKTQAVRSDTHNTETAAETVAWTAKSCTRRYLGELVASPPKHWLYVEKAWGCTPVDVEFDEAGAD